MTIGAEQTRTGDTRLRLAQAALELFADQGFDATTVDQIATRAGVSKTTFFRHFPAKEEVIFPDHTKLLSDIATMFEMSEEADRLATVCAAARHVLKNYVHEGDIARARFRLTAAVNSLRDAEVASIQVYQRTFQRYLAAGSTDWTEQLAAQIKAASVIAANNFVMRRWLREEITDPLTAFDEVRSRLLATDWSAWSGAENPSKAATSIIVLQTQQELSQVLTVLQQTLGAEPTAAAKPAKTAKPAKRTRSAADRES